MASAADVLNVARSYLGVHEDPPHSNDTIIGEKFGWNGVAWCAEGVSVDESEAGVPFNGSASCSTLVARYQSGENGVWLGKPDISEVRPGDEGFLGTRGQDHTWLLESVDVDARLVHCIDDNWADQSMRVTRPYDSASIYGFGRPNYDVGSDPALPPPSATAGRPILRNGNTGSAVSDVQRFLNGFNSAGLTVDDDFGDQTEAAVKAWQTKRGLTVDGEVGPETWHDFDMTVAFVTAVAAGHDVAQIPTFPGTVNLNSPNHDAVRQVQQRLADRGWTIGVDGGFGKQTLAVVEAFQREKGLTVDGVAGPATWNALWTSPVT